MVDQAGVKPLLAIVISASIFAVIQFAEGPLGVVSNGAFDALLGWIYLKCGRNMWITIIGHGLLNSLRFSLRYAEAG